MAHMIVRKALEGKAQFAELVKDVVGGACNGFDIYHTVFQCDLNKKDRAHEPVADALIETFKNIPTEVRNVLAYSDPGPSEHKLEWIKRLKNTVRKELERAGGWDKCGDNLLKRRWFYWAVMNLSVSRTAVSQASTHAISMIVQSLVKLKEMSPVPINNGTLGKMEANIPEAAYKDPRMGGLMLINLVRTRKGTLGSIYKSLLLSFTLAVFGMRPGDWEKWDSFQEAVTILTTERKTRGQVLLSSALASNTIVKGGKVHAVLERIKKIFEQNLQHFTTWQYEQLKKTVGWLETADAEVIMNMKEAWMKVFSNILNDSETFAAHGLITGAILNSVAKVIEEAEKERSV